MGVNSHDTWLQSKVLLHICLCLNFLVLCPADRAPLLKLLDRVFPVRLSCEQLQERYQGTNIIFCPKDQNYSGDVIYFGIESLHRQYYFRLKLSADFLAPAFNIEEKIGDLFSESIDDQDVRRCFYEGNLINDETSKVTMNVCNGLQGVIRTFDEDLYIKPSQGTKSNDGEHLLYMPEPAMSQIEEKKKHCATPQLNETLIRKVIHDYKLVVNALGEVELVSLKPSQHRKRRAISLKHYIEMMVVTDESMFEFYGRNEIELRRYILSVMAIVSSIMKDRSIGNFVEIALIKLVILKKNPPTLKVNGAEASESLRKFCKWQRKQNKDGDNNPEHFDTAFLLTRNDLCSTSCDTLGLAELGTSCDPQRSCSIVEDNGLSSAFTIAHELGHLLNAPHDGDNNECDERSGKVHVMTPTFNKKSKTWTWSTCSQGYITNFLESVRATCLLDKPSPKHEHPLPMKLPGEMFTLQEQCQLIYGDNSTFCNVYGTCHQLWCIQYHEGKKSCQSNNMPWADGTNCGRGNTKSWCIRGKCQRKQKIEPVHGQWGSWSAFGSCSRTCGGGVKVAKRKCNKPKPANNGNYCIGSRHKYKSCNSHKCPYSKLSFRAIQCNTFNGKKLQIPGVDAKIKWLPKLEDNIKGSCKLLCEMKGYKGIYYELSPKVIDGTKCSSDATDMCVDGKCRHAGCDNVLDSNAKVDNCGVCNGDNSTCITYTGYKNDTVKGYNFVAHIPRGASHLNVLQQSCKPGTYDTNFLALLNHDKRYILNGHWTVSVGHRIYTYGGTRIYYSGASLENETIRIPTTLKSPIEVQVLSIDASKKCGIMYSYNFPVRGNQTYHWVSENSWSKCFPVCKGFQIKEHRCEREVDSQFVSPSKCAGRMPKPKFQSCNHHCKLLWKVYPSDCVPFSSCGNGVQAQKIECIVQYDAVLKKRKNIVSHKNCRKSKIGRKPPREVPCYVACSSVGWIYSAWSKCSSTCGGGIQYRKAFCVMQTGNATILSRKCSLEIRGLLERLCNTHECPKWVTGAWSSDCSVTCGEGQILRTVYCALGGVKVNENMCNDTKPDNTRACLMGSCAFWKYRSWSKCSKACGGGYQIREVYCEKTNGEQIDDLECERLYKPKNRRKCFIEPCVLWASLVYLKKWNSREGSAVS